ncbi:MAG: hypothetical protein IH935_09710 [Acidobacteria bacterium]|nr:hypothetical protein [Acidobacteriota bacterium]
MNGNNWKHRRESGLRFSNGVRAGFVLAMSLLLAPLLLGQTQPEGALQSPLEGPWERGIEGPWKNNLPTSTGPAVGEKIPFFRAPDQFGKMQDFNSIVGPQGAVIVFNRSVDW